MDYLLLYFGIGIIVLIFHSKVEVTFDHSTRALPPRVLRSLAALAMVIGAVIIVATWPYAPIHWLMQKLKR